VEQALLSIITTNLSLLLLKDAKFYAERLYNLYPSESNLNILAKCYYQEKKPKQTYLLLQGTTLESNRYLFALSCIDLGKFDEGERALSPPQSRKDKDTHNIPGGAAGLYLLGKIAWKQHRRDAAVLYFKKCLEVSVNEKFVLRLMSFY
jgi:anaphase-promoting complex subunit 3